MTRVIRTAGALFAAALIALPSPAQRSKRKRPKRAAVVDAVRTPAMTHTSPRSAAELRTDLGSMLTQRVRSGKWGVMVISLGRGDTLFSYNPDEQMLPASTMKMYTTAIALDQFGPNYQFSTDALADGTIGPDGTLKGNLIIRGDGDPTLSNRYIRGPYDAPMRLLAKLVAEKGIKQVSGDIVGDASAFDDQRIPEGWLHRYIQLSYAARVSALSLNENVVWIAATGTKPGENAQVSLEPASTTMPLTGSVRTVGGSGARITARRTADGGVEVHGTVGVAAGTRRVGLIVEDPALFTTGAFRAALEAEGIKVTGTTRLAPTPAGAKKVASVESPTLDRIVSAMNRESINHFAELLFRDAARGKDGSKIGNVANGMTRLKEFLTTKAGAAPDAVSVADGSGLSTLDRVTPRSMVDLLSYAHRAPWGPTFHASLPVAGESELLRRRMKSTSAQGNLHAKTGTTNEVISLGGYVTAQNGEVLAFSFIYNGTDRWNAKSTIDVMGETLAAFTR